MELNNIILVVEDRLSDAVATKILQHLDIEIVQWVIYEGNSYLQRKAQSYNQAAHADRQAVSEFLSIPTNRIPQNTDEIANPKEFLVSLARRSKNTRLQEALVPAQNDKSSKTGNEYNPQLSQFVREHWNLERAAAVSPSLKRTLDRLSQKKNVGANR